MSSIRELVVTVKATAADLDHMKGVARQVGAARFGANKAGSLTVTQTGDIDALVNADDGRHPVFTGTFLVECHDAV